MINIEDKIEKLLDYFKAQNNILAVWIIGSYGTEYQRENSDIDFAVLYDNDVSILNEAKTAMDISDILNFENIDIVNLRKSPITLQFNTIKNGRSLYEADYIKVCDYMEMVINTYQDRKYYIDIFDRDYFGTFNVQ